MKKIIVLLLVLSSSILSSQNTQELFSKANSLYKKGNYLKAIELYNKIENSGNISSELYYNLGNCNYKLNNVAPSIYNYEKALQLDPLNEDAQNNLIIAKKLTLDRIEELPKSIFQKLNNQYLSKISYNAWAVISIILSFITAILFLLFYFSHTPSKKRLFFSTSVLSFLLLVLSLTVTYSQFKQTKNNIQAIIFPEEIHVKNAPTSDAEEVFILHEGTKVTVLDVVDQWKKIKLADGKIGWMLSKNLKEL